MSVQLTSRPLPLGIFISQLVFIFDLASLVLPGPQSPSVARAAFNDTSHLKFSVVDSSLWPKDT